MTNQEKIIILQRINIILNSLIIIVLIIRMIFGI